MVSLRARNFHYGNASEYNTYRLKPPIVLSWEIHSRPGPLIRARHRSSPQPASLTPARNALRPPA